MIKYFYVCILFLCVTQFITAQNSEIRGAIIEKKTGEPMIGATVLVVELPNIGTTTDVEGNYSLRVAPGVYTLRISYLSFKTIELTDVIVETGKSSEANVAMEESESEIGEVVIVAVRRMNSEVSIIAATRVLLLVVSGISAQ